MLDRLGRSHLEELRQLRSRVARFERDRTGRTEIEEAYRILVDRSLQGLLLIQDRRIVFANEAATEITGYRLEELLAGTLEQVLAFVHPDDRAMVRRRHEDRLQGLPAPSRYEFRAIRKDGGLRWLELQAGVVPYRGRPAVQIALTDITAHKQTELALQRSEREKSLLLDSMSEMFACYDVDLRIHWASQASADSVGMSRAQLIGRHCYEIWHQRTAPCAGCPLVQALRTREPQQAEITSPDGHIWHLRGYPLFGDDGQITGLVEFGEDITERKRTEQALRESRARLQSIFDSSPDAITVTDLDGKITECNRAMLRTHGFSSKEQVIGRSVFELIAPADRSQAAESMAKTLCEGTVQNVRYTMVRQDGTPFPAEISASVICGPGGQIAGFAAIVKDITRRLLAIAALEQSEQRFRAVAEYTCGLECWVGTDGRLIWLNPAVERLTGYTVEECLSMPDFPAPLVQEEDRARMLDLYRQAVAGSSGQDVEYRLRHKNGAVTWLSVSWQPIYGIDGSCLGHRSSHRDITDRRLAEEALRENEERYRLLLQNANDAVYVHEVSPEAPHCILDANERACRMLGYTREELLGMTIPDLDVPKQRARVPTILRQPYETGSAVFETEHRAKDGRRVPVEISTRLFLLRGQPTVLSIVRDITERKQAEERLRQSEAALRAAQRVAHVGSWAWHIAANRLEWSDEMFRIFGLEQEGFSGDLAAVIAQAIHPDDRAAVVQANLSVIHKKTPIALEYRVVRPDGSIRVVWAEAGELTLDADGNPAVLTGIVQDITERKRAEETLRQRNQYIETIMENAPIGFAVNTIHDHKALFASSKFEEIYGVERGSLNSVEEFFDRVYRDPVFREEIRARVTADIATGDPARMCWEDIPLTTATGERKFITAMNIPLFGQNLMVSTVQDVTARHLAQEALREKTRVTSILLDALPCVALLMRPQTRQIVAANEAAMKVGAVPGARCFDTWGQRESPCPWCLAPEVWVTGKAQHREVEAGGVLWDAYWSPVTENLYLHYAFDITELRRTEQQAKARQDELVHVSRLSTLGEMASGFAHELNQPLSAILSYASVSLHAARSGQGDAPRLIRNLDQIAAQARRAGEIIKRVRAFAQRRTPRLGPVDLPEVIREVLALVRSDLRHREIDVRLELGDALPPVVADPIQIGQALLNLVRNAIEALDSVAPRERRLTVTVSTPIPNQVQVTVSDTGAGLPADLVSRIFDPFFTTKANGLGIGLSITRSIIELHRGHLWVEPGAGRGCTFAFTLPAAR